MKKFPFFLKTEARENQNSIFGYFKIAFFDSPISFFIAFPMMGGCASILPKIKVILSHKKAQPLLSSRFWLRCHFFYGSSDSGEDKLAVFYPGRKLSCVYRLKNAFSSEGLIDHCHFHGVTKAINKKEIKRRRGPGKRIAISTSSWVESALPVTSMGDFGPAWLKCLKPDAGLFLFPAKTH